MVPTLAGYVLCASAGRASTETAAAANLLETMRRVSFVIVALLGRNRVYAAVWTSLPARETVSSAPWLSFSGDLRNAQRVTSRRARYGHEAPLHGFQRVRFF